MLKDQMIKFGIQEIEKVLVTYFAVFIIGLSEYNL